VLPGQHSEASGPAFWHWRAEVMVSGPSAYTDGNELSSKPV
jgi:hypothetical protein